MAVHETEQDVFAEVLAHVDEVVYRVSFDPASPNAGEVRFVGGGVEAILGVRPEEFASDRNLWFSLLHPDDVAAVQRSLQTLLQTGRPTTRVYRLRARFDDRYRWMEDRVVPQLRADGGVAALFGVARDVTARIEGEHGRAMLEEALCHIGDSVMITDRDANIVFVNAAFTTMTGYADEEVRGRNARLLASGRHDRAFYESMWGTLLAGEAFRGELTNRRRSGEHYVEEKTIAPIRDTAGQTTHFVSVGRDATERRRRLDRAIAAQRLEAMGLLAAGVAHDFNNYLTVIAGYTEMLQRAVAHDADALRAAQGVALTVERSAALTRHLLRFARRQHAEAGAVSSAAVVEGLRPVLERLVRGEVELRLEVDPACGDIHADPARFEQIVLNLVINARQAIAGSGTVTVQLDAVPCEHAVAERNVRLRVSDTGIGMDGATLERIFEPLFTTRGEGGGSGLGLATVRAAVDDLGGRIEVQSAPGAGTTFTVLLPELTGRVVALLAAERRT